MWLTCAGLACAGALQQVVANDPLAQRVVAALSPTLSPIADYAARTPFFSAILAALASNDNPVVSSLRMGSPSEQPFPFPILTSAGLTFGLPSFPLGCLAAAIL